MKILGVTITEQEIIDLLGDRVNKDENPLVSSKIDFTDFLTLFVCFHSFRFKNKMKLQ